MRTWHHPPTLAGLLLAAGCALAQSPPPSQQRGGTYVVPPAKVDPVYTPLGPDRPDPALDEPRVTLRLAVDLPLQSAARQAGSGTQGTRPGSPTLQAQLRWRPLADRGWYVQATGYRYLSADRQRPWDPDFTYGAGYDDGGPGWTFGYANYSGTRLSADPDRRRFNAPQGQWSVGWRFRLSEPLEQALLVGDGDAATCSVDAHYVARYTRQDRPEAGHGKVLASLGCRYTRPGGWFVQGTAYAWPDRAQQQPWDPDYTYAVGWAGPQGWSVQYGNYSGNRWSSGRRAPGEGRLRSGSVSLGWTTGW